MIDTEQLEKCEPVYEVMPGWTENTARVTNFEQLPKNAVSYIKKIEELTGVPVHIISTGPERNETIMLQNPFN